MYTHATRQPGCTGPMAEVAETHCALTSPVPFTRAMTDAVNAEIADLAPWLRPPVADAR